MSHILNKSTMAIAIVLAALVTVGGVWADHTARPGKANFERRYGPQRSFTDHRPARQARPIDRTESRQSYSYAPDENGTVVFSPCGCWHERKVATDEPKEDTREERAATRPESERRSFSYEPADEPQPRDRSFRSAAPSRDREPWLRQKADRRRYSP